MYNQKSVRYNVPRKEKPDKTERKIIMITNVTTLRKNLFEYVDDVVNSDNVTVITTKNGNAVLVNEDYFRALEETCYLLSIPGMEEAIVEGLNTPTDECETIDWKEMLK